VTIAIHTPDSDEMATEAKQDKAEEKMIEDFNQASAGSEDGQLIDMDVENLRTRVRDLYHEVRSIYSENRMA